MSEQNCYGDGTVFEGVRSKDSVVSTLQLAIDLEGPHGMITLLQSAAELRRLHEVNEELVKALVDATDAMTAFAELNRDTAKAKAVLAKLEESHD